MACFLVDPAAQTIEDVEPKLDPGKPFLDSVRDLIGAHQLLPLGIFGDNVVMFIDNFGLMKRDPKLWGFRGSAQRIAGKGLMFGVVKETGNLAPIPPERLEDIRAEIAFAPPGVTLLRIEEMLLTSPGEIPMIHRVPVYSDDPVSRPELEAVDPAERTVLPLTHPAEVAAAAAAPLEVEPVPAMPDDPPTEPAEVVDNGWVIRARKDGTVTATRFSLKDGKLLPIEMRSAATIAELREQMPPGVSKVVQPSDDEPEDVLEFWVS